MLKRWVAAIQQWLSAEQPPRHPQPKRDEALRAARRGFFKRAAVSAVSVSGTAGLAKVVVDSTPSPDLQDLYRKDHLAGEKQLQEREYVLMSDQEKAEMVGALIKSHSDQG